MIHTHSTHLVACSLQADTAADGQLAPDAQLLPPITPYFVMKVGRVPHIPYHRPGDAAAAAQVAQTITHYAAQGSPVRAVMLARLGPNVWHDTPAAAMAVLEELEETARLWMLCQPRPTPLTERQIEELRQAFWRAVVRPRPAPIQKDTHAPLCRQLSMLYNDVDFLDRFAAAARDGFKAVEYLFPYAYPAQELAARLQANGLQQVLFTYLTR